MHPSSKLLQACRITLFTRSNCSLCTEAKRNLSAVWDARPFVYREVDVMKPDQVEWRELYEFDTPVIHVSKTQREEENAALAGKAIKLMHRFTAEEVQEKMDLVEKQKG